jgi:hypothetical protein
MILEEPRDVRSGSRLCENVLGRRMRRIVFSIAFFRKKLPAQSTPRSTKSRWKFYTQVGRRSFHTAWVIRVILTARRSLPVYPSERTSSDRSGMSVWCQ